MKTTMKMTLLTILSILSVSALAQEAAETTREINAQTTVTRGHIDNIIQRIGSRRTDTRFNARDYWEQNPEFRYSLDTAMKEFEDQLEKAIFPKAAYWMDQYNAIATSSEFSSEQKAILLKQRLENIKNQFAMLSQDYQSALKKVYDLVPSSKTPGKWEVLTPNEDAYIGGKFERIVKVRLVTPKGSISSQLRVEFVGNKDTFQTIRLTYPNEMVQLTADQYRWGKYAGITEVRVKKGSGVRLDYATLAPVEKFGDVHKKIFQDSTYLSFKGSCKSTICLGLRASDHASLLTLIRTNLDRNITLRLADGNGLAITGLNQNVDFALAQLARVDYPEELPFDL